MLKRTITALLLVMLILSFTGCGLETSGGQEGTQNKSLKISYPWELEPTDPSLFKFSYEMENSVWKRGGSEVVTTSLEYLGKEYYSYSGSPTNRCANPILYYNEDGSFNLTEKSFMIKSNYFSPAIAEGFDSGTVIPDATTLSIPTDAPLGKYHLILHFEGYYQLFENAIEIAE